MFSWNYLVVRNQKNSEFVQKASIITVVYKWAKPCNYKVMDLFVFILMITHIRVLCTFFGIRISEYYRELEKIQNKSSKMYQNKVLCMELTKRIGRI